jgi:hypothetical protein
MNYKFSPLQAFIHSVNDRFFLKAITTSKLTGVIQKSADACHVQAVTPLIARLTTNIAVSLIRGLLNGTVQRCSGNDLNSGRISAELPTNLTEFFRDIPVSAGKYRDAVLNVYCVLPNPHLFHLYLYIIFVRSFCF